LALGQSLNVPVLAEGVESAAQLQMLESEGCDEVQGFYLGAPAGAPSLATARADLIATVA
jgi:EAL domain-containing protein (putative c-di-GMP-specific phosphodiesterase class I)